ncbi:MAG: YebC/PmpR family DNA-binding transcriptional regulator [Patescibacteria group bacterium]|jgi:YebC/PmpR family DNA-binding regulatory protein
MSGHSKWATTHRQKEAADAKKGAIFTKLANLITIAARESGGDTESNFKLRLAVDKARAANMPKDNVERAIKKGTGEGSGSSNFEQLTYEIFGPDGTAFIVEAVTDNRNRTIGEIKAVVNKNGGQMAGQNSVAWMFDRRGYATIDLSQIKNKNTDELELELIDAGADEVNKNEDSWEILCSIDNLQTLIKKLQDMELETKDSGLSYFAKDEISITDLETQAKIERFYSVLEDLDDVNNVYTNANW